MSRSHGPDLASLAAEVGTSLDRAGSGRERRGLLRLQVLVLAGQREHAAELRFIGD